MTVLFIEPLRRVFIRDYFMIRNIGFILLAVFLILFAISIMAPGVAIPNIIVAIVALASAIFILIGR